MGRITIVGMGPIGVSIGLALKKRGIGDTEIVGTAKDRRTLSSATQMGAVDSTDGNLKSAVRGAGLVILDASLKDTEDLLEALGQLLDTSCVITDTGASKGRIMELAEQHLPKGIDFVGGHPLIKKRLEGPEDADAALFEDADYCIMPAESANKSSVKTVVGLVETLGAVPYFLDRDEHDSYAAAMNHLPIVLSTAFVTAVAGSEGWREMHRLAASDFGDFSRLAANDPEENEAACLAKPDALVHWLDRMIAELYAYRSQIKERSQDLIDSFANAQEARDRWEAGMVVTSNARPLPSTGEMMGAAFVGQGLMNRYKEMTEGQDKKDDDQRPSRRG